MADSNDFKTHIEHSWSRLELHRTQRVFPDRQRQTVKYIHHPGAVVIVPVSEEGKLVLVRQYRPAVDAWVVEFPAGTLEENEASPLHCAQRELQEEANLSADKWQLIGKLYPAVGFCDEVQHIFAAHGLSFKQGECDEDEFIEVIEMDIEQFEQAVKQGDVADAKTIAAFTQARLAGLLA